MYYVFVYSVYTVHVFMCCVPVLPVLSIPSNIQLPVLTSLAIMDFYHRNCVLLKKLLKNIVS
jgi:hypothetical protein